MKIKDGYIVRQIVGEWVVIPSEVKSGNFESPFTLSETAHYIWNQLLVECSLDDIVKKITNDFDVDKQIARKDVISFIEVLKSRCLIEE